MGEIVYIITRIWPSMIDRIDLQLFFYPLGAVLMSMTYPA